MITHLPVILASSSVYRQALLQRLLSDFECATPHIDEAAVPGETPAAMATRLASLKAHFFTGSRPDAIVIGSDQVPALGAATLHKPGDRDRAIRQLTDCSGRAVEFLTAVTIVGPGGREESHIDRTNVLFRELTTAEIERYVDAEQPLDCAGSFKAEGLGIALFERIDSADPTALQGLPLIWLAGALRRFGLELP